MMARDPRIDTAHAVPMAELVDRLGISRLVPTGIELVGPCPSCGGKDRFGINLRKGVFQCRRCDAKGDQIALVQLALNMDFKEALEWLAGPVQELTPAQKAVQRKRAEEAMLKREQDARRHREAAIKQAQKIWSGGQPGDDTLVGDYLAKRGIVLRHGARLPRCFKFEPSARLVVPVPGTRSEFQTVHEGPAMLSEILDAHGELSGVHRTWIDLTQAKGRPVIKHPFQDGQTVPTKKSYGSKKGGAIRLFTPRGATKLVMAEGIETTLSAMMADEGRGDVAYWAGIDLGNMSGQRKAGPGQRFAGIPDLTDRDAFVPPAWVKQLIFIQDGDSEPKLTRAKVLSGLRRAMAMRPGLTASIAHPGEGVDMNDLLLGGGNV